MAAAPIRTPAGIQSGIAVTRPARAAATRVFRAPRAPVRARGRAGEREHDDRDGESAADSCDYEQCWRRIAAVDVERVEHTREVELGERIGIALAAPSAASVAAARRSALGRRAGFPRVEYQPAACVGTAC
jgi:hypothetical protein